MIINKKIVLPLAAVGVIGAAVAGVTVASAASSPSNGSLAQRIATTFGLDQSKVQTVINQYHSDQQTKRDQNYQQRLDKAVTNGKITSAQEQAILAEHNKLASEFQAAMQKTGTDRREALKAIHTEAQTWAKQNNISPGWLLGPRPLRGGMGMGHMGMMNGADPDDNGAPGPSGSPTSSPSPTGSPSA